MKQKNKIHLIVIVISLAAMAGCHSGAKITSVKQAIATDNPIQETVNDTTPKVTGIGGIFFFSDDPSQTRAWYSKNLGLETNEYGSIFEFRNARRPEEINYLQWSPFRTGNSYFAPSKKDFMINYRVQNLVGLVRKLKANGVTVVDEIETFDYGKFVHILDPEGNKVELWEPVDHVMTNFGGKTTK